MQAKDETEGTVLHAVCTGGSVECLKFLLGLGEKHCDFFCKDSGGYSSFSVVLSLFIFPHRMTPLHRAAVAGHLRLVYLIIFSGLCTKELINMQVLHYANDKA